MEPINVSNQKINHGYVNAFVQSGLDQIGKSEKLLIPYDDQVIQSNSKAVSFTNSATKMGPVVRSPQEFMEEFATILSELYGKEEMGNVFKSIFGFIKKVINKLGGWDKLIDIVLILCPLPKSVKIVLEVLKKILPLLTPSAKNGIGDMIKSALSTSEVTDTPEELLQKMTQSLLKKNENVQESVANAVPTNIRNDSSDVDTIIADKTVSLEDKVMAVLMRLAEKQEQEILDQANTLDKSPQKSRDKIMIELQIKVQKLSQTFQTLSNTLKVFHETAMNSVRNIR